MKRSNSASEALLAVLRRALRHDGWTARRLAVHFAIGEATAKRWLAGRGLTLERLEALAGLCHLSLADLAREAEHPATGLAQELTLAQERALSSDTFLSFLFMTLLGGTAPGEFAADLAVPAPAMETALARLERLALIDRLPGGRVRPLIDRRVMWRKTPMRALFNERMKLQFLAMDFSAADAVFVSEIVKLSPRGAGELAEMLERLRRDVQALSERDRDQSLLPRKWYAMMGALRELDMQQLQDAAREGT